MCKRFLSSSVFVEDHLARDERAGCFACCIECLIRMYHECEGWIEKSAPRITVWHQEAFQVMTNGDTEGWVFLSHPYTNFGFFSDSPLTGYRK